MTHTRVTLSLVVFALLLLVDSGAAEVEPPNRVRTAAEEEAVTVRVFDPRNSDTVSIGSGFVVYDDENEVVIATAKHVISAADPTLGYRVEVRFFHRGVWIDTKSTVSDPGRDIAFISMDRHLSPYDIRRRADSLPTTPAGDGAVWAIGYDHVKERLEWRTLWPMDADRDSIKLRGDGLAPGFSGGLLVSMAGRVGMLTDRGPGGVGHKAIACGTIARSLQSLDLKSHLSRSIALDALQHALDSKLMVGMYTSVALEPRPVGFWSVVELAGVEGGSFVGRAVNLRKPGGDPELRLTPESSMVRGQFSQIHGAGVSRKASLDTQLVDYRIDPAYTDTEMLALRADTEKAVSFLMIPRGATELLAARAMLANVQGGSDHVNWPRSSTLCLEQNRDYSRDGQNPIFGHTFLDSKGRGVLEFQLLPRLVAGKPVTITGTSWVPHETNRKIGGARLAATRVTIETVDGRTLGRTVLGEHGGTFSIRLVEVPQETLVLRLENSKPILSSSYRSMVTFLKVEYEALAR
jgi:hypothetical protein